MVSHTAFSMFLEETVADLHVLVLMPGTIGCLSRNVGNWSRNSSLLASWNN